MKLAINQRLQLPQESRKRLSRTPIWLLGLAGFVFGTLLSFAAFKFAAQSLLAGLSSVQFLSQVFFSKFILHERVDRYSYMGVFLICMGCVLIVIYGTHETKNYGPEEIAALFGRSPYVCFMLFCGSASMVSWVLYNQTKQRICRNRGGDKWDIKMANMREKQVLGALFSFRTAIWGTQAVVLAKALSMLLNQALNPQQNQKSPFVAYQTYFILIGFVGVGSFWLIRLNHALRLFDAVYIIPMLQMNWILFSSLSGGVFYDEFNGWGLKEFGIYTLGVSLILAGVALLCPRASDERPVTAADVAGEFEFLGIEPIRLPNAATYEILRDDSKEHFTENDILDEQASLQGSNELGPQGEDDNIDDDWDPESL
eukprot:CAMPEP_0184680778 /NCGR_PEP_ID=MMETSP0312-20130426/3687_1 /TAXON_ID=31354 /ORGANISM="Compsopogon coeruleus, Strain SAG 36.94" /LENGTH=369 /DNA_ID=CAMNT_0027131133 /DNA_START=286 /DNA_END=1396 /DNA_ORIENTATION=+